MWRELLSVFKFKCVTLTDSVNKDSYWDTMARESSCQNYLKIFSIVVAGAITEAAYWFAHSDFLRVSFLDLLRWYICISISLKQYFWNLCINFFVLYSQRKESVPLLWQNQMCYSWKAVSLMRTPSFVYLIRNFNENHKNFVFFSSIIFCPPGRGGKFDQIWQKEWSAQFCTVLQWKMVIWFIALRCKNPCFQLHNYLHCKKSLQK